MTAEADLADRDAVLHAAGFSRRPLGDNGFGQLLSLTDGDAAGAIAEMERDRDALPQLLQQSGGLLLVRGMQAIADEPELLVRLSRLFGPEVEDYRRTLTPASAIHPDVPEILIVSNAPPVDRAPPPRPDPPLTADGSLPVRFPHRRGWHTDQSFRRPPPDVSLFYCVEPAPEGQGQTLYACGTAAYEALSDDLKGQADGLEGMHVLPGAGRSEQAVRAGETPRPLKANEQPQCQPVVRTHPLTGRRALYLCEAGQMDWITGPFVGMEPGPDGEGARLLYALMHHYTAPDFTYAHEWRAGDLTIYDNRSTIHSATWFDADNHRRVMWRTTTYGYPDPYYAGEERSWER